MLKILGCSSVGALIALGMAGCLDSGSNVGKSAGSLGGGDARSAPPVPLSTPTCDTTKLFSPPAPVPGFDGREIISGRVSSDELSAVVSVKNGATGYDFFNASRATTADPFVLGTELAELNTPGDEFWPTLSADGLTIHFESARPMPLDDGGVSAPGVARIWEATRPTVTAPFGAPIVPGFFQVDQPEAAPSLGPGGRTLYFSSLARGKVGGLDLFVADVNAYGVVTGIAPLPSSPYDDNMPIVTADQRALYFGRDTAISGQDILVIGRQDDFPPFGVLSQSAPVPQDIPQDVVELNTIYDEFPMSISTDACRLYFVSNRPVGGTSQYRVWLAEKPM
jgi:WD40-like Beta Propeller Repeat